MISVLIWNYSRHKEMAYCLPKWLEQVGVDYEIIIAAGPDIVRIDSPKCRYIPAYPPPKMGANYNALLQAAKGDKILVTQADMEVNDPEQLKRMADICRDGVMVSEKFFKEAQTGADGVLRPIRQPGIFLQFLMVTRKDLAEAGGWWEYWDCPAVAAHEDTDLICRLVRNGVELEWTETPEDKGVYHLHHSTPYLSASYAMRVKNGLHIYKERNPIPLLKMLIDQKVKRIYGPKRI